MEALLREVANVQWRHPTTGSTALIAATLGGNSRAVHLLLQHGADPNEPMNASGISPLLAAAMKDRPSCAHALLMAGADLTVISPYFGTASLLATKKGHERTLAVLQRPQLCLAHQRLAVATSMNTARPMTVRHGRETSSCMVHCIHDAAPFDLPYDVLLTVMELLPGFSTTYLFATKVVTDSGVRHRFSRSSNLVQSATSRGRADATIPAIARESGSPTDREAERQTDREAERQTGSEFCGNLGREQFLATRTSTMNPDNAPGFVFDANPGGDRTIVSYGTSAQGNVPQMGEDSNTLGEHHESNGSGALQPSLVLEFEVPTPDAFRRVIELYYNCVAPEKGAAAKGAEAVRLAARQQQQLLRQHAPILSVDGAQQFAFQQVFALLRRKYRHDPLTLWRAAHKGEANATGDVMVTTGATAAIAAAGERERAAKAAAEASQADAESAIVERQLAAVQQQIKQLD